VTVNCYHTRVHQLRTVDLLSRFSIHSIDTYIC